MYDLMVNIALVMIYALLFLLVVTRWMEAKNMDYSVTQIPSGRVFSFKLGVYAGTLRIVRRPGCVRPWFIKHVDGWEIVFPMAYSDDDVHLFLLKTDLPYDNKGSHSQDLAVYREVVIRGNDALACVGGKICSLQ